MARINWFEADKALANEVASYMRCKVWHHEYQIRYAEKVRPLKDLIKMIDAGDWHPISGPSADETRADALNQLVNLDLEHKKIEEEYCRYAFSDAAKKLRKGIKSGDSRDSIIEYFRAFGLDISETNFADICISAGGQKDFDRTTYVNSNGGKVTCEDSARIFKHVFAKAYESMVAAGTIKRQAVPAMLMYYYDAALVQKRKEAKKAAKKNNK